MRVSFALWLLTGIFGCQAGLASDSAQEAIVGGQAHTGDPAVVLLDLGGGLCTGTLISPRMVLTAAHCLDGPASSIRALFVNAMSESGTAIGAVRTDIKEGTDLGLVTLASDGPVAPIAPNPFGLDDHIGEAVKIVGFGVTSENGSDSGTKRMGMATLNALAGDGIRAGELTTTNDPSGTCYGDSGGPNFMTIDGVNVVAGVTSRGTDVCGAGLDVAVRVDAHIGWIRQMVAANDPGDCSGDGRCAQNCASVDPDCCATDGQCVEECGAADLECGEQTPAQDGDEIANAVGACSAGSSPTESAWLAALLLIALATRRRRASQTMTR